MTMPASTAQGGRDQWGSLRQPQFVISVILLFVAAVSFNSAVRFLKWHFRKEAVPLRHAVDTIPVRLGPWIQISKDQPLDKEMQDVLATDKYIFRDYVDTRRVSMKELEQLGVFQDKSAEDLRNIVGLIETRDPSAVVRLAVTYYTGLVDTVAHIPDRCYVADGFEVTDYTTAKWPVGVAATGGGDGDLEVRYINFEDATPDRAGGVRNVAYFFHCNGSFESDPLRGVRIRLQNLTERKAYYAKVELMTVSPSRSGADADELKKQDSAKSAVVMTDFLKNAMPEVLKCLPDWKAVMAAN